MEILTPEQSEERLKSDIEAAKSRHKKRLAKFAKTEAAFQPKGISPAEQRCLDALALREAENLTFKQLAGRLGVSSARANQLCLKGERIRRRAAAQRELSVRAFNCIYGHHLWSEEITPEAVAAIGQQKLLDTPNFGPLCLTEIMQWLKSKGLNLAP